MRRRVAPGSARETDLTPERSPGAPAGGWVGRVTRTSRPPAARTAPTALCVLLLALSGCGGRPGPLGPVGSGGSGAASEPASASASGSASGSATPTEPTGRPATVVLTRTGGLAGFADRLDVAPDGTVTGTRRAGTVSCRVAEALATTLVSSPAPTAEPAAGSDRITVTLDRLGTTVVLGEAQGADALSAAARSLLDDVQQPEGRRTVCR